MEVKATHKLVSLASGAMWDLADTEHGHYWNKITGEGAGEGWKGPGGKSVEEEYSGVKSFILIKLPVFKGNK